MKPQIDWLPDHAVR